MTFNASGMKEQAIKCAQSPKQLITYFWFAILFTGFLFSLAAIVFAANNNGDGASDNKSLGFAGIWMMLMVCGLSFGGTMVMRKFQNRFAVGLFTGVVVMMALNMFSLMVLFAGAASAARADEKDGDVHSDEAAATFSFFMFFLYSIFCVILVKHRHVIIKEDDEGDQSEKNPPMVTHVPMAAAAAAPPVSV